MRLLTKEVIRESGMTIYEIHRRTDLPYNVVKRLANSEGTGYDPKVSTLVRLAVVLHVSLDRLVDLYDL